MCGLHDPIRDEVRGLQQNHADLAYPPSLRGEVIDGVDMVMVDADIAGCPGVARLICQPRRSADRHPPYLS